MRYTSVALGLLCCPILAYAQGTRLLRQPTVSNTQIAFAYAGDIWVAGRDGGDAKRLTSFPGTESNPHFSPDGKQIAFSMQYGGNTDVYVIDAAGGEARRLTWHPGPDIARGWSPDAKRILFSSARISAPSVGVQQLWTIAATGGVPERLPIPDALRGSFSPDGQRLAYEKVSRWDVEWRNYRGGQTHPVTIYTVASQAVDTLPSQGTLDTWPVWMVTRFTSSPTATGTRTSGNTTSRPDSSRSLRITRTTTSRRSTREAASSSMKRPATSICSNQPAGRTRSSRSRAAGTCRGPSRAGWTRRNGSSRRRCRRVGPARCSPRAVKSSPSPPRRAMRVT